MYRSEDSSFF